MYYSCLIKKKKKKTNKQTKVAYRKQFDYKSFHEESQKCMFLPYDQTQLHALYLISDEVFSKDFQENGVLKSFIELEELFHLNKNDEDLEQHKQ